MVLFAVLVIAAYLLGSVPVAYLIARRYAGVDIRLYGTGNVGMSNVARVASKKAGVLVALFDVGKGALVVFLAKLAGVPVYQQALIGAAAIAGHNWPVFLGFSGGRGVLTAVGVGLMVMPWLLLALLVIVALAVVVKQLAIVTIVLIALLPVFAWFWQSPVIIALVNWPTGTEPLASALAFLAIFLLMAARRLTAPRTPLSATVGTGKLLLYRFFLDRDIKDKEAWVRRDIPGQKQAHQ